MTIKEFFNKNNAFNFLAIVLAVFLSNNILKGQQNQLKLLEQRKEEALKKNQLLESISRLEKRIFAYQNLLARKDAGMVIDDFSKIAKETGIKIIGVRPAPAQRFAGYTKVPFDLVLSAPGYHALGKFISRVESYKDVYMAENLDVRTQPPEKDLSVLLTVSHFQAMD